MWEVWGRRRWSKKEAGFETEGEAREGCFHTGWFCWSSGSEREAGSPPSLESSASRRWRRRAASEAGGSPQPLWAGGETPRGEEGEGTTQSHSGEAGSSPSRGAEAGRGAAGEEGRGTLRADGASGDLEVPTGDSPNSVSQVWEEEQEAKRTKSPWKETRWPRRSWRRFLSEGLVGRTY